MCVCVSPDDYSCQARRVPEKSATNISVVCFGHVLRAQCLIFLQAPASGEVQRVFFGYSFFPFDSLSQDMKQTLFS